CAGSGTFADPRRHRVQVDIGTCRQQRLFVENGHALEPALEERPARVVPAVGQPRQGLLQALDGPTAALQPLASFDHQCRVLRPPSNPIVGDTQWLPPLIAWRKQPPPRRTTSSSDYRLATSGSSRTSRCRRLSRDGEPGNREEEDFRKFPEPVLDADLAVVLTFAQQERAAHAAGHAVLPARDGEIDQM